MDWAPEETGRGKVAKRQNSTFCRPHFPLHIRCHELRRAAIKIEQCDAGALARDQVSDMGKYSPGDFFRRLGSEEGPGHLLHDLQAFGVTLRRLLYTLHNRQPL